MSIHRYVKKDSTGYRAFVQISATRQISKCFERKSDAQAWEDEQRTLHRKNPNTLLTEQKMTFGKLADHWMQTYARLHKSASSMAMDEGLLRLHILPFFGNHLIGSILSDQVELWLEELRDKRRLAPKTCNLCLGLMRKILSDGVRWKFMRFNPILLVKGVPHFEQDVAFWTAAESAMFLGFARKQAAGLFPIFAVALYTGLRLGELIGLKWDVVDFARRQITVKRMWEKQGVLKETTKTRRIRRVPINQSLFEILIELRQKSPESEFVLPRFHYTHASKAIRKLAKRCGVKPIRFHDLRHSFASIFMMSGGSIYDLQKLLGHSTVQMTERYSHLSPEHLSGKTEFLDFGTRKVDNVLAFKSGT